MAKGNQGEKRAQHKLKDEEMRFVIDVLLYLVQVHASSSSPVSAEMDGGPLGSS